MPLVTGNITVGRVDVNSIVATISAWYAGSHPSPTYTYIDVVDNYPLAP